MNVLLLNLSTTFKKHFINLIFYVEISSPIKFKYCSHVNKKSSEWISSNDNGVNFANL